MNSRLYRTRSSLLHRPRSTSGKPENHHKTHRQRRQSRTHPANAVQKKVRLHQKQKTYRGGRPLYLIKNSECNQRYESAAPSSTLRIRFRSSQTREDISAERYNTRLLSKTEMAKPEDILNAP